MTEADKIWFSETERFGYTLQCVGRTEKEVVNSIIEEYVRAYKIRNNGIDPRAEYLLKLKGSDEYDEYAAEDFEVFRDELYVEEREFGKVEWR